MPARIATDLDRPMTAAERKARQRQSDALRQRATADTLDAAILRVFKAECSKTKTGLVRRDLSLSELVQSIALQFPLSERRKVYDLLSMNQPEALPLLTRPPA